jgi:hypothetical protein
MRYRRDLIILDDRPTNGLNLRVLLLSDEQGYDFLTVLGFPPPLPHPIA